MHVDMDAFFASIEQLDNPEYKGHPRNCGWSFLHVAVVATCSMRLERYGPNRQCTHLKS